MNKKAISLSVSLALGLSAGEASAISVSVTEMVFGNTYGTTGVLSDSEGSFGFGEVQSIDDFFFIPFTFWGVSYFEETGVETHFLGNHPQGAFDYQFILQPGQIAWGMILDFSSSSGNGIPVLNIMDCGAGEVGDVCTGIGTPLQTGPFPGQTPSFNGVVVVPVPATSWLLLSGLAGLVSVARRRRLSL